MATALYLRNTTDNGIGSTYLDMLSSSGSATATCIVNTQAGGTEIQWTTTGGGAIRQWISGRVPAGGFTLSGQMTFSIWANESSMSANCGIKVRVFKRTAAGVESEVVGSGWAYGTPSEISTGATEYVWNGTPTSGMSFAENDRILIKAYIINVGTMGGGYTCTLSFNNTSGSYDSFFQINETVTFKAEGAANYSIVGAVTVGSTIASTMDYTRNASIVGSVTVGSTVAATMTYSPPAANYSIVGAVTIGTAVAATMAKNEHYSLTGAITIGSAISSTLTYNRNASILGSVTINSTIAATMVKQGSAAITGSVPVVLSISSTLDYTRNASIIGSVTVNSAISSSSTYNRNASIIGGTTVALSVAAPLDYTRNASITGNVTISSTIASNMKYNFIRSLTGGVPVTISVASTMSYGVPAPFTRLGMLLGVGQ